MHALVFNAWHGSYLVTEWNCQQCLLHVLALCPSSVTPTDGKPGGAGVDNTTAVAGMTAMTGVSPCHVFGFRKF